VFEPLNGTEGAEDKWSQEEVDTKWFKILINKQN
jgi:hypothetical protein